MAKSDRPLSVEERANVADALQTALQWTGVKRTPPTPAQIHDLIVQSVDGFRKQTDEERAAALEDAAFGLGALWGQVLCDQFAWVWVMMQVDKVDESLAVVTSTRSHLIYPLRFFHKILGSPAQENSVDKIFKAIQTNKLPKSIPRGYMVISGGKGTALF